MPFKLVILWTDGLMYLLVVSLVFFLIWSLRRLHIRRAWRQVMCNGFGVISLGIILLYLSVGLMDSIHFRLLLDTQNGTKHYSVQMESLLDLALSPLGEDEEKTYSAPFALTLYSQETQIKPDGVHSRIYPKLKFSGQDLLKENKTKGQDIVSRIIDSFLWAFFLWSMGLIVATYIKARLNATSWIVAFKCIAKGYSKVPWRLTLVVFGLLLFIIMAALNLAQEYHILGTNKVGQDVFYLSLKSIRTGLIIGTLTTLIMLPFALFLGTMAGYFRGIVDDVIQYLYTTLSSIPGVLLIAAAILSLQIFISNHPHYFATMTERADIRLLALCIILGITSWTGLCRVLRGETLKLREIEYVQAATALGVGRFKIIRQHLLPNIMHLVVIAVVLDFSMLVLAEAVLTYVGVGVDPTTMSWGNMINSARLELAREPVVWWPLMAAFGFMFTLVLAANLFSDAVRDAFDPRIKG